MLKIKALTPAIAAVVLSVSTGACFAQYKGPPIIVQTPTLPQPTITLTPTLSPPSLTPTLPPPVAAPVPAKPATAAPATPTRP
jgi:hypothetical protein